MRKTSPRSRLPDSARMRSWAAQNSASSGSGGSEPAFSSSICSAIGRAGRPDCRGFPGCAEVDRRGGPAASPGARRGRGRRRRDRGRRRSSARAGAVRRARPKCRSRAPRRGPSSSVSTRCASAARSARCRGEDQDPLGGGALLGKPRKAPCQGLGLACSGGALQPQRALAVWTARCWVSARASMLQR